MPLLGAILLTWVVPVVVLTMRYPSRVRISFLAAVLVGGGTGLVLEFFTQTTGAWIISASTPGFHSAIVLFHVLEAYVLSMLYQSYTPVPTLRRTSVVSYVLILCAILIVLLFTRDTLAAASFYSYAVICILVIFAVVAGAVRFGVSRPLLNVGGWIILIHLAFEAIGRLFSLWVFRGQYMFGIGSGIWFIPLEELISWVVLTPFAMLYLYQALFIHNPHQKS